MQKRETALSLDEREASGVSMMKNVHVEAMGLSQIQRLVHLLDRSDIGEIEVNRAHEGLHLVLRKGKTQEFWASLNEGQPQQVGRPAEASSEPTSLVDQHCLKAHMVGLFHHRQKPHGRLLVAVGDLVKVGQVVGTIEALGILNEITATVGGRVLEIRGQDGQLVEYGQVLLLIENSGAKA